MSYYIILIKEKFHIISDGSCDLPTDLVQEKNITVVPFYVSFDDTHYFKENVEAEAEIYYVVYYGCYIEYYV